MSQNKYTKLFAATCSFALASTAAQAADMWVACQVNPCYHDSHGQSIATEFSLRQMSNGQWYRIQFNTAGPVQGVDLYYADERCQGAAYLWTGNLPWDNGPTVENFPFYAPNDGGKKSGDGGTYWVPKYDAPTVFTPKGFKYIAQNRPDISGVCQALRSDPVVGHPAQTVDDRLYPPYGGLR